MEKLTARYALTAAAEYQKVNDDVSISDFAEGYMTAIKDTNIVGLFKALDEAKKQIKHLDWKLRKEGIDFGVTTTLETLNLIDKEIKKATE